MIDLDKIRSLQSLSRLSFEDSKLAIFTRLHKYEDAVPLMLAELDRLTAALAAAQAAPVVEWYATTVGEAARVGMFWMGLGPGGWTLRVRLPYGFGAGELIDSGPETGPAGKAACEAAYRRAVGLPPK